MIKHTDRYNTNLPFSLNLKYLLSKYLPWHYCKLCGIPSIKLICDDCVKQLETLPKNICKKCCKLLPHQDYSFMCKNCSSKTVYFDKVHCKFIYAKPLNKILHEFKYNGKTEYAYALGSLLYPSIINAITSETDVIIPMPLHTSRQKERGFNQAEYLLHYYMLNTRNTSTYIRVDNKIIARAKNTKTQAKLGNNERENNLQNAFQILKPVINMKILLIDDVVTTGASVNEVAKLLKLNGAKEVNVCCLARTL